MEKEDEIEKHQKEIINYEKKILNLEKEIETKEKEILKNEGAIFKLIGGLKFLFDGISIGEIKIIKSGFNRRFKKHRVLYSLTIVGSIVLIWRGIWGLADATPGLANPFVSILAGILILWVVDKISDLI